MPLRNVRVLDMSGQCRCAACMACQALTGHVCTHFVMLPVQTIFARLTFGQTVRSGTGAWFADLHFVAYLFQRVALC